MKFWYVVQSQPQKELFLREQLYLRGIETYFPSIRIWPVNPRARKIKAYFPGHLFMRVDQDEVNTASMRWIPGAARLVSFGSEPATVPDELIQTIRNKVNDINARGGEFCDAFEPGEKTIRREGFFTGFQAIFDARLSDSGRARVFLEVLRDKQLRIELPVSQIELVKRSHS
jgi:transcriptional antiterminator RfaH